MKYMSAKYTSLHGVGLVRAALQFAKEKPGGNEEVVFLALANLQGNAEKLSVMLDELRKSEGKGLFNSELRRKTMAQEAETRICFYQAERLFDGDRKS